MSLFSRIAAAIVQTSGHPIPANVARKLPNFNGLANFQNIMQARAMNLPVMPTPPTPPENMNDSKAMQEYHIALQTYNQNFQTYNTRMMTLFLQRFQLLQQAIMRAQQSQSSTSSSTSRLSSPTLGVAGIIDSGIDL